MSRKGVIYFKFLQASLRTTTWNEMAIRNSPSSIWKGNSICAPMTGILWHTWTKLVRINKVILFFNACRNLFSYTTKKFTFQVFKIVLKFEKLHVHFSQNYFKQCLMSKRLNVLWTFWVCFFLGGRDVHLKFYRHAEPIGLVDRRAGRQTDR